MQSIPAATQTLLDAGAYAIHGRLWIHDATLTYQNYEDWALEASISADVDNPAASLNARLMLRDAPSSSLSPLMGATNLDVGRMVKLEVGYAAVGATPTIWTNVFEGAIDRYSYPDDITLQIECRDLGGALMDRRVETPSTYGTTGGRAIELVMGDILSAWAPGGVTLYTPTSPGYLIKTYTIEQAPTVMEALQQLADLIGWEVRYRWDTGSSSWRLTLSQPRRNITVPDYILPTTLYHEGGSLVVDRDPVRNLIVVGYASGSSRSSFTASDGTSIGVYGRRFMRLAQLAGIDTLTEATTLANAVLADLKDPKAELSQSLDIFPWVELGDYYRFAADNVRYSSNQDLAVVHYEHHLKSDVNSFEAVTSLKLRGKPVSSYYRWHEKTDPVQPPGNITLPGAPTGLTGNFTGKDAILTWTAPDGYTDLSYEVTVLNGSTVLRKEIVVDTRYAYTFENNVKDGGPRPSLNFEVRSRNTSGNLGSPATTTLTNLAPSAPASVTLTGQPLYFLASVPEPAFADYLRTEWQADDTAGFASPTSAAAGPDWQGVRVGLEAGSGQTYVRARFVDAFGQASGWTVANSAGVLVGSANIAAQAVGIAQFAAGIRPVGLGSSLPANPYTGYQEGDLFMLVSGGAETMYRLTNPAGAGTTGWTPAINTNDLADNAITASKILAGSITAGKIAAGAVSTTELAANAATIEKLAITAQENFAYDPGFEQQNGWTLGPGWAYQATGGRTGPGCVAFTGTTSACRNLNLVPCRPGEAFFAQAWIRANSIGDTGQPYVRIDWLDSVGVEISSTAGNVVGPTDWNQSRSAVYATAPAGAAYARVECVVIGRTTGTWFFDDVVFKRAEGGEVLIDGTLTANKINVLDLSAIVGTFGGGVNKSAIDNRGLRVYDSAAALRVAMGDIGGLAWGSGSLAAGTYGFYGDQARLFLRGYAQLKGIYSLDCSCGFGNVAAGYSQVTSQYSSTQSLSFSYPTTLYAVAIGGGYSINVNGQVSMVDYFFTPEFFNGSSWVDGRLGVNPASNVTSVRVRGQAGVWRANSVIGLVATLYAAVLVFEQG